MQIYQRLFEGFTLILTDKDLLKKDIPTWADSKVDTVVLINMHSKDLAQHRAFMEYLKPCLHPLTKWYSLWH